MTQQDILLTEDYLIMKGLEAFSKDPDKTELIRQINIKEYSRLTDENKTRVGYYRKSLKEK